MIMKRTDVYNAYIAFFFSISEALGDSFYIYFLSSLHLLGIYYFSSIVLKISMKLFLQLKKTTGKASSNEAKNPEFIRKNRT